MAEFLESLRRQRERIARMVERLEGQLDLLAGPRSDPDYRLLRDMMHYFCHYPSSVHYPFEDELYARLAIEDPAHAPSAAELARRHERQALLASNAFGLLDGVCSGHLVPRDKLLKELQAYATLQREHLMPLSERLFAAARATLGVRAVDEVESACAAHTDPTVRMIVEDEFARLEEALDAELSAAA